jgi:hypothetical protein
MICEKNVRSKLPFDVQHRNIILYDGEAPSDFRILGEKITARLKTVDKTEIALQKLSKEAPLAEVKGLSAYERIVITAIVGGGTGVDRSTPDYTVRNLAGRNGLTDFAIGLALKKLSNKGFIYDVEHIDPTDGERYLRYSLTEAGWQWIIENEDDFALEKGEDIPF